MNDNHDYYESENNKSQSLTSNNSILYKVRELREKLFSIWQALKVNPKLTFVVIGVCIAGFILFSSNPNGSHKLEQEAEFSKENSANMHGIKEAVDPRDAWVNKIESRVDNLAKKLKEDYENIIQEKENKINNLEQDLNKQLELIRESLIRVEERSINSATSQVTNQHANHSSPGPSLGLGYVKRQVQKIKKDIKDYAPSGSHARAVLLTGLAVGTGTNSSSAPEPIVLRLTDSSLFALGHKTDQIKEATLIGDCSGDISSERAKCRLQTLSLKNRRGEIIEKSIEGWVIGEDGRAGIKGDIVDKSSNVARTAVLSGVLGGISQFFQSQSTKGIFPISPLTGQSNALKPTAALKGGAFQGAGNALDKLADYAIARAEQMSPVIMVASGREVDIVFRKGIDLNEDGVSTTHSNNLSTVHSNDQAVDHFGQSQEIIGGSSNFTRGTRIAGKSINQQVINENNNKNIQSSISKILEKKIKNEMINEHSVIADQGEKTAEILEETPGTQEGF